MTRPLWDEPGSDPAADVYDYARIYYGHLGQEVPDPIPVYVAPHAVEKYRELLGPNPHTPDGKRIEIRAYGIARTSRESDPRMIIVIAAISFALAGVIAWLIVSGIL